jgi:hypothetical protein
MRVYSACFLSNRPVVGSGDFIGAKVYFLIFSATLQTSLEFFPQQTRWRPRKQKLSLFEVEEDEKLTSDMDAPAKTATVRGWRASEATQLNRLVIALFDSQALVFQSVTEPVLT